MSLGQSYFFSLSLLFFVEIWAVWSGEDHIVWQTSWVTRKCVIFTLKIEFGLWSSYTVSFQSFERLTFYFLQVFLVFMWTQEYKRMTNKRSLTRVCLYVQPRWLNLEQPWFCLLLKRNAQRKKNLAQSCPTADHFLVALP